MKYTWNLADIYPGWEAWEADRELFERQIAEYAALKGTLAQGAAQVRTAFQLNDTLGRLAHRVYFYPSLRYDEDQRDNTINARKQQVEALFARWQQATSWLSPELLTIPLDTVRGWMAQDADLAVYRFAIEEVYPAAGTRARRGRRTPPVTGRACHDGSERGLLGALDI